MPSGVRYIPESVCEYFIYRKLGGTAVDYRPFAHCAEGLFVSLLSSHVRIANQRFILIKEKNHAGFKRAE